MKLQKIFTIVIIICIVIALSMMVDAYLTRIYVDDMWEQLDQRHSYREQIKNELRQLELDYATSSKKIAEWVKKNAMVQESIDFDREYSTEELDKLDASTYINLCWGNMDNWGAIQYENEVNLFISSYGYMFLDDTTFVSLLTEREKLYCVIKELQKELYASYEEDFEWRME